MPLESNPRNPVLLLCIVLLAFSNGFSLWRFRRLSEEIARKPSGLSPSGLAAAAPAVFGAASGKKRLGVLFIYRIRDCPAAVQELETLDAIAASRPDLDVHAVLVDGSASEAHQAEKDFALRYRIVADPNERLYDELLPPMTPWKAVILRPAFAILAEEGPSTTPAQREAFLQRMNVVAAQ